MPQSTRKLFVLGAVVVELQMHLVDGMDSENTRELPDGDGSTIGCVTMTAPGAVTAFLHVGGFSVRCWLNLATRFAVRAAIATSSGFLALVCVRGTLNCKACEALVAAHGRQSTLSAFAAAG